ncbi:hypothetical protein GCM10011351_04640 [Paraliobacillus quinghaiensis]|uniref:Uncharacterized protein n=1 Tax=Paraliobacillus quinghaiensis TaxID=470815 RepID=A0A917TFR6_9BACI|nr:YlzJ-like family protein [Paraliobacillus quinghaiensis]GGM21844.1 hypothetical protein GCM10011351_04640 [Paraliobacillus quinghaiensis]
MILYTPLCEHDVFPTDQSLFDSRKVVNTSDQTLLVDSIGNGSYRIVQLLSTNPQDYLSQSLTPGEVISE